MHLEVLEESQNPKSSAFPVVFLLAHFEPKKGMFNLNENNRMVMSQHPIDMRIGVDCLRGQLRTVGLDPTNGDVYIFVNESRRIMKLLH